MGETPLSGWITYETTELDDGELRDLHEEVVKEYPVTTVEMQRFIGEREYRTWHFGLEGARK